MALGQAAVGDRRLDAGGEVEESQRVRHGRSRPADPGREVVLAEPELLDELPICFGSLERIEVFPLEVLDQRDLELLAIGELPDDRRDALDAGRLRGAEATLTGHELVAVEGFGDEDRLEHAMLEDARGQRRQAFWVEALARLERVRCGSARSRSRSTPSLRGFAAG